MNGKTASSNHSGEVSTQRSSSGAVRPRWATGPRIAVLLAAWFLLLAAILVLGAGTAVAAEAKEPSHCPRAEYEAALAEVDQAYSEVPRFPPPEGGSWPQEIYAEQLAQAFNAKVEEGFFEPRFKVRPGIDWSGCDLEGAELARADLAGADLSGANLEDAELGRANLEGANLTDAKLADAELAYASLSGAQLDGVSGEIEGRPASLPENWTLVGAYCRGYGVCLYYLAGPGADLYEAYLRGANLSGIDLAGADLERADLDFATLAGADLAGAELAGAEVVEVESGGIVGEPASLPDHWALRAGYLLGPGVWLRRAELAGADLHGIDLEHAHLEEAALKGSDLEGTDLEGADVESAELENANLQGANLQSAKLAAAEMAGADLAGADLAHARMEEVELERGTLEDANLTDATLEYAYLTGDDIAGADFSGAQLEGVTSGEELGTPASLPEPWRLVDGYLIGPRAELGLAHLTGAELAGADLEEAEPGRRIAPVGRPVGSGPRGGVSRRGRARRGGAPRRRSRRRPPGRRQPHRRRPDGGQRTGHLLEERDLPGWQERGAARRGIVRGTALENPAADGRHGYGLVDHGLLGDLERQREPERR